ncbi:Putative O-antigen transporter [Terrisporobacter petrolearius]|uniref:oligosaccharide flippase family protein n=1 Tax=Terrisporobacter petrolearius TaxID=1460447 RepID=UPI0033698FE1
MESVKKNFFYNSAYQILILIIPLITTPYIARVLGADGIGIYSYRYSIANYFMLFIMLGLNNYGNRTIAKIRDNYDELAINFWSIYYMQLFLGIIINVIYIVYSIFVSDETAVSLVMGLYVISSMFDINWLFFGLEKFRFIVGRNFVIKIFSTTLIFLLVKNKSDVLIYCGILSISTLFSQIVLWPYVLKVLRPRKIRWKEISVHIKPNAFLFLTVIAVSLFKIMDKIMLGVMTNNAQVGFYESSEKVISIPMALITSLGTVMLPRMSNLIKNNDVESRKVLMRSVVFAMFLATSMGFGIMSVSNEFVPLFFGPGYDTCKYLLLILLPSCIFLAFANVVRTQFLLPNHMDNVYVLSAVYGAITNIIINIILIPIIGSVGAAIGTLLAELVVCVYQCIKASEFLPIIEYVKKCCPFIISGIIMFLIVYSIEIKGIPLIAVLLTKIIIGIIIYACSLGIQLILLRNYLLID